MKKNFLILRYLVTFCLVFSFFSPIVASAGKGRNYALLIGIGEYKDKNYKPLNTPEKDVQALSTVLKNQYDFKVTVLKRNVSKADVIKAFKKLSQTLKDDDRLLIYYSGYGEIEKLYDYSWWIPSDAKKGNIQTYIDNTFIKKMLGVLKARHILLITDSAFSATNLERAQALPGNPDQKFYINSDTKKSRWGIFAGTIHPSLKKTIEGHGILAYHLINALKANTESVVSIREIFNQLKDTIEKDTGRKALCKPIRNSGHNGGEFILTLAQAQPKPQVKTPPKPDKKVKPPPPPVIPTTLLVNVNVEEAVLFLDGIKIGVSPYESIVVNPGEHVLLIKKDGYTPFNGRITVEKGKDNVSTIFLNEIKPITGTLAIKTTPENATIEFQNSELTYTEGMALNFGKYDVKVASKGYESQTLSITIEADQENLVTVQLRPLQMFKNSLGMTFQYIASGKFMMGSPENESNRGRDETQHQVTINKHFYMQTTEVTVGQFKQFVKATGYKTEAEAGDGTFIWTGSRWMKSDEHNWKKIGFVQNDNHPVACVSWEDTQAFIKWLSEKEKQKYALPTEGQWEYTCRAGTMTIFSAGDCLTTQQANFDGNSIWGKCPKGTALKATAPVAEYPPNAWGIYDMHGNLWEWVRDWYGAYPKGSRQDPLGPKDGTEKTVRGGAWDSYVPSCRSANRSRHKPIESYSSIGFRLVCKIE